MFTEVTSASTDEKYLINLDTVETISIDKDSGGTLIWFESDSINYSLGGTNGSHIKETYKEMKDFLSFNCMEVTVPTLRDILESIKHLVLKSSF
jgi:hypothetical protein